MLADRFESTMQTLAFMFYLGLMLVIGWNFFEDDRILFILIVLYVVVVGGIPCCVRRRGPLRRALRRASPG